MSGEKKVNIEVSATDNASSTINNVGGAVTGLTQKLSGTAQMANGVSQAFSGNGIEGALIGAGTAARGAATAFGKMFGALGGWVTVAVAVVAAIARIAKALRDKQEAAEKAAEADRKLLAEQDALARSTAMDQAAEKAATLANEVERAATAAKALSQAQNEMKSADLAADLAQLDAEEVAALGGEQTDEQKAAARLKYARLRAERQAKFDEDQARAKLGEARGDVSVIDQQMAANTAQHRQAEEAAAAARARAQATRDRLKSAGLDPDAVLRGGGDDPQVRKLEADLRLAEREAEGARKSQHYTGPAMAALYEKKAASLRGPLEAARSYGTDEALAQKADAALLASQADIGGKQADLVAKRQAAEMAVHAAEKGVATAQVRSGVTSARARDAEWGHATSTQQAAADKAAEEQARADREKAEAAERARREADQARREALVAERDRLRGAAGELRDRVPGAQSYARQSADVAERYSPRSAGRSYNPATDRRLDQAAAEAGRAVQVLTDTLARISERIQQLDAQVARSRNGK
jgi:hypothetical protein